MFLGARRFVKVTLPPRFERRSQFGRFPAISGNNHRFGPPRTAQKTVSWTRSGGYSSDALSSTTWVWNLHADAHTHPPIVSAWFSAAFIAGARFSNYEQWLVNPLNTHPLGQLVWSSRYPLQETVDQDSINTIY